MSHKKLEIWSIQREVVIEIHKMTLNDLLSLKCLNKEVKYGDRLNQSNHILLKGTEGEDINRIY